MTCNISLCRALSQCLKPLGVVIRLLLTFHSEPFFDRVSECSITFATSVRHSRVLTRFFTLIPAPFTVGAPYSYRTLVCHATLSTLYSLFGQLLQASVLPPASFRSNLAMMPCRCLHPSRCQTDHGLLSFRMCARQAQMKKANSHYKMAICFL